MRHSALSLALLFFTCHLCQSQDIRVDESFIGVHAIGPPSPVDFPNVFSVTDGFSYPFNDSVTRFHTPQLSGTADFFFRVDIGDEISIEDILDNDLRGIATLRDMPFGESYYGFATTPDFQDEATGWTALGWVHVARGDSSFEVIDSEMSHAGVISPGVFFSPFPVTVGSVPEHKPQPLDCRYCSLLY